MSVSAAQQRSKSVLLEMLVLGQRLRQVMLVHDPKRGAIRQAPPLIGAIPIQRKRITKELAVLWDQMHAAVARYRLSKVNSREPQGRTIRRKQVEDFYKYHF
jgi:hypothetical protein